MDLEVFFGAGNLNGWQAVRQVRERGASAPLLAPFWIPKLKGVSFTAQDCSRTQSAAEAAHFVTLARS
jgi:hypothetical protein